MRLCRSTATLIVAISLAGCAGPSVTVVPSSSMPASVAASGGTPLPSRIAQDAELRADGIELALGGIPDFR